MPVIQNMVMEPFRIRIWIMDNALTILSHELGHVKYQVPNLENYAKYYKETYGTSNNEAYLGHNPSDPSGKCKRNLKRYSQKIIKTI